MFDYSLGIQKLNGERIIDRKENHENAYQIPIIFKCTIHSRIRNMST